MIRGMKAFLAVWTGQIVSMVATNMTGFGLTIWAYQLTGSATALALVGFFFVTPMLIISPLAGALVDRSNRKLMMALSDLASGVVTIAILILYTTDNLQIWHLYITGAIQGTFQAFQWPAYSAAITLMVPKEQYGRANGLMTLADSASGIFAPVLAGALIGLIGLGGILAIDIATFVLAIAVLLIVHIPQPAVTEEGRAGQGSIWKESAYGFRYILERPSLLGLQIVFLVCNFVTGITLTLMAPMILARTANNSLIFGSVSSVSAAGGVVGGLVMSAWGGTKRRVHGVLLGWALFGLLGVTLMGLGREIVIWAIGGFLGSFFGPIINASNQAIWQAKVAPDVQGRVFSIRRLIAWFVNPAAMLVAGPLADRMLGPAMNTGGSLAPTFSWLVGSGPGAGMSLIYVFCGLSILAAALASYSFRAVREVETILPDHDAAAAPPAGTAEEPSAA